MAKTFEDRMRSLAEKEEGQVSKVIEHTLDNPEKTEEAMKMLRDGEIGDDMFEQEQELETEETTETDDKATELPGEKSEDKKEDTDESTPKKDTVEEPPSSKSDDDEPVVTEEYLSQFGEEAKEKLGKYLGKPQSEITKALLNAQKLLGRKQSDTKADFIPKEIPRIKPAENELPVLEKMKIAALKRKYPDIDWDDQTEADEQLKDVNENNPREFIRIEREREQIERDVESQFNTLLYVKQNHKQLLKDSVAKAKEGLVNYMKSFPVVGKDVEGFIRDAKIDFTTPDENNQNPLFNFLISDGEGGVDPEVVTYVNYEDESIPMIIPDALQKKALLSFAPLIVERVFNEAYKLGFNSSKKTKNPKSLFATDTNSKSIRDGISLDDVKKAGPDEIQKLMKQL